jgi:hypothetical protein
MVLFILLLDGLVGQWLEDRTIRQEAEQRRKNLKVINGGKSETVRINKRKDGYKKGND